MAKRKPVKPEEESNLVPLTFKDKDGRTVNAFLDKDEFDKQQSFYNGERKPITLNEIPLDNRIILKEDEPPSVRPSGIVLEGESKVKPYTGVVLAVGPDCSTVKLHDQVRYPKRAGEQIEINGEEYLMLRETDCYTILNK